MLAADITPFTFALTIIALAVNLAVHEAAHAVRACRAGNRVALVTLGIGPVLLTVRVSGIPVFVRAIPLVGHIMWESTRATRATRVRVALAGPLATLVLAGCVLAFGGLAGGPAARVLLFMGAVGLVPLMPGSDGARAWDALRGPAARAPTGR